MTTNSTDPVKKPWTVWRVIRIVLVFLLLAPLTTCSVWLAYLAVFGSDHSDQCILGKYSRTDGFKNGQRTDRMMFEGAIHPVVGYKLYLSDDEVFSALWNNTISVTCDDDLKFAYRITYSEFRDPRLTQSIVAWREGKNTITGFRSGKLISGDWLEPQLASSKRSGTPHEWDETHTFSMAPEWLPRGQLNESTFIAFWGSGFLFRGSLPDQYFWVGYY